MPPLDGASERLGRLGEAVKSLGKSLDRMRDENAAAHRDVAEALRTMAEAVSELDTRMTRLEMKTEHAHQRLNRVVPAVESWKSWRWMVAGGVAVLTVLATAVGTVAGLVGKFVSGPGG